MNNSLQIPVGEFATQNPVSVDPDDNLITISQLMTKENCKHILVTEKSKAIGIISDRDIHKALIEDKEKDIAKNIMSTNVYCVNSTTNIDEVILAMSDQNIGSAIIEDEEENIVGIFTLTDVLTALATIVRGPIT